MCGVTSSATLQFMEHFLELFYSPLAMTTLVLMLLWFAVSFG